MQHAFSSFPLLVIYSHMITLLLGLFNLSSYMCTKLSIECIFRSAGIRVHPHFYLPKYHKIDTQKGSTSSFFQLHVSTPMLLLDAIVNFFFPGPMSAK